MSSKLDRIRQRVVKGTKASEVTSLYYLIKELKCLPDILGREFEVEYEEIRILKWFKWYRIKKIIQKPIKIPTLMVLLDEMKEDYKRQEREAKKIKSRRR
jgi:hypothetical protein